MANAEIRVHDSAAVYAVLLADPECRGCGRPACEAHHLVPKGGPHFGDDIPANVVPLCRTCHDAYHSGNGQRGMEARARIGRNLSDANISYVIGKLGALAAAEFLHRKYLLPRSTTARVERFSE